MGTTTTTTSLSNTPQAADDAYNFTVQALIDSGLLDTATNVVTLDVMANDAGGKARSLYSVDDGQGALADLLASNVSTGWEHTFNADGSDTGILIRIDNGKVQLDLSGALAGGSVQDLSDGETVSGSFLYAIRMGNGTLSYATITFSVTGEGSAVPPPIVGTEGSDTIYGTEGNDTIHALGGDDYVDAGGGADVVMGGDGSDILLGGEGNDTLYAGGGDYNVLVAGAGDDVLYGTEGPGVSVLAGGDGDDTLQGGLGYSDLDGGDGNDTLVGGAGFNNMNGGAGADHMVGGSTSSNQMNGGDGNDVLLGGSLFNTMRGGNGDDHIVGGIGFDSISGDDGDDVLEDLGGGSALAGDAGNDTLIGGDGADALLGGSGNDRLSGGKGDDFLSDYSGLDTLNGGAGSDYLYALNATFVFDTPLLDPAAPGPDLSALEGIDTIAWFDTDGTVFGSVSMVELSLHVYAGLADAAGTLSSSHFHLVGESDEQQGAQIVYNPTTGALLYDSDGDGAASAVQFATLSGVVGTAPLSEANFTLA